MLLMSAVSVRHFCLYVNSHQFANHELFLGNRKCVFGCICSVNTSHLNVWFACVVFELIEIKVKLEMVTA